MRHIRLLLLITSTGSHSCDLVLQAVSGLRPSHTTSPSKPAPLSWAWRCLCGYLTAYLVRGACSSSNKTRIVRLPNVTPILKEDLGCGSPVRLFHKPVGLCDASGHTKAFRRGLCVDGLIPALLSHKSQSLANRKAFSPESLSAGCPCLRYQQMAVPPMMLLFPCSYCWAETGCGRGYWPRPPCGCCMCTACDTCLRYLSCIRR